MHRIRAGLLDGLKDLVQHQIAFARRRRSDEHRLVRHLHGQAVRIRLRIHRNRRNPQTAAGLDHPDRDLATVRYQYLVEHERPQSMAGGRPE
jgi:hypothetical protein